MALTTVYDVQLNYTINDRAASGLNNIAGAADKASRGVTGLKDTLLSLGAALGIKAAFDKGKEAFIGFNSSIEQAKIGIAGVQRLFDKGLSGADAKKQAEDLFGAYQQEAIKSTATTQDFLNMHLALAPAAKAAGTSLADMQKIVTGATVAAPILLPNTPDAAAVFARDIESMMRGNVTSRDRGAKTLISSFEDMGKFSVEEFNKKAKSDPRFAIQFINRALNQKALVEMRTDMEQSFAGVASTLEDTLQILGGEAGKPLFKLVTEEIKSWNKWLLDNRAVVQQLVVDVGEKLAAGFRIIKDVVSFVVQHKDAFLALAEAFLAAKVVAGFAGSAGSVGNSFGGLADAFTKMATEANMAALGIGALVGVLQFVINKLEGQQRAQIATYADWQSLADVTLTGEVLTENQQQHRSRILFHRAMEIGAVSREGLLDVAKLRSAFPEAVTPGARESIERQMGLAFENLPERERFRMMGRLVGPEMAPQSEMTKPGTVKKDRDINVTIHRIEVPAADPDRFVFGLVKKFNDIVRNPVSADGAIRGT